MEEREQWDTWNMGIGLVMVVAADDADAAVRTVPEARVIGRVERARDGERRIRFA